MSLKLENKSAAYCSKCFRSKERARAVETPTGKYLLCPCGEIIAWEFKKPIPKPKRKIVEALVQFLLETEPPQKCPKCGLEGKFFSAFMMRGQPTYACPCGYDFDETQPSRDPNFANRSKKDVALENLKDASALVRGSMKDYNRLMWSIGVLKNFYHPDLIKSILMQNGISGGKAVSLIKKARTLR